MVKYDIRSVDEVNGVLQLYYKEPEKVLSKIIMNR
jgi:hypothetical protein